MDTEVWCRVGEKLPVVPRVHNEGFGDSYWVCASWMECSKARVCLHKLGKSVGVGVCRCGSCRTRANQISSCKRVGGKSRLSDLVPVSLANKPLGAAGNLLQCAANSCFGQWCGAVPENSIPVFCDRISCLG